MRFKMRLPHSNKFKNKVNKVKNEVNEVFYVFNEVYGEPRWEGHTHLSWMNEA